MGDACVQATNYDAARLGCFQSAKPRPSSAKQMFAFSILYLFLLFALLLVDRAPAIAGAVS
jgi:heme O synthase-like polyprenyltransferase